MRTRILTTTAMALALALPAIGHAQQSTTKQGQTQTQTMQGQQGGSQQAQSQSGQVPQEAKQFAEFAANSGMFEVQSSELAKQNAQDNQAVQKFAQRMIDDHGKANDQLKQIAQAQNIQIPQKLDSQHQQKLDQLKQASGSDFVQQYVQQQVQGHQDAVRQFEQYSQRGQAPELKTFAQNALPTLQEHLRMARDLQQQIQSVASNSGQASQQGQSNVAIVQPGQQSGQSAGGQMAATQPPAVAGAQRIQSENQLAGVQVEDLMGKDVLGSDGKKLGDIDDIILDPQTGQARQAVIASGGFLGLGEKKIAVDFRDLQIQGDKVTAQNLTQASVEGLKNYEYDENTVSLNRRRSGGQTEPGSVPATTPRQ